jgi:hypothetical protein
LLLFLVILCIIFFRHHLLIYSCRQFSVFFVLSQVSHPEIRTAFTFCFK